MLWRMPEASVTSSEKRPDARFGARVLLVSSALVLLAVPFGLLLLLVRDRWRPLALLDEGLDATLHRFAIHHEGFVSAMAALSFIGSAMVYVPVFALVAAWVWWRGLPRLALFVVVAIAGNSLLNWAVKLAVNRSRPVLPDPVAQAAGMSFPSGHAQSALVAYAVLLLVFVPLLHGAWRPVALAVAIALVVAIGFSRLALGVHYLSDVLAGYALGGAWIAAMTASFNAWKIERGHDGTDARRGLEPEELDGSP